MMSRLMTLLLSVLLLAGFAAPLSAREGDTLLPITIDAPALETYPADMMGDSTAAIEGRVTEARNSGVPVAVRIVDMSLEQSQLPASIRRYATTDFTRPLAADREQAILNAWIETDPVETTAGANDGFLLLVLVTEDPANTKALWWVGPNALPLNGLTTANIQATRAVISAQFSQGSVANGVYLGLSEFSYNIQFGEPERLELTHNQTALHYAVIPLAVGTIVAALAIPVLALWMSRRQHHQLEQVAVALTPWQAAALELGRARSAVTTGMLVDAVHQGWIAPTRDGGLVMTGDGGNGATLALAPFADANGMVAATAVHEIEGVTAHVRREMEDDLARIGVMNAAARIERTRMLLLMGFVSFLAVLAVVPTIMSMARIGVFAIVLALICLLVGWGWLSHRSLTTPGGHEALQQWLERASADERQRFDLVVHQTYLIDHIGGPDVSLQTRLVRQLRGLGAT